MATKPTVELSQQQARAVAAQMGVKLPAKDNSSSKVDDLILRRLPMAFRKTVKRNKYGDTAKGCAYRLQATTKEQLYPFWEAINANGKSRCICYPTD